MQFSKKEKTSKRSKKLKERFGKCSKSSYFVSLKYSGVDASYQPLGTWMRKELFLCE